MRTLKQLQISAKRKQARLRNIYGVNLDIDMQNRKQLEYFTNRNNARYMKNKYGDVFKRDEVNIVKQYYKEANERLRAEEKRMTGRYNNQRRELLGYSKFSLFEPKKVNLNKVTDKTLYKLIEYIQNIGTQEGFNQIYVQYWKNYMTALDTEFHGMADDVKKIIFDIGAEEFNILYYKDTSGVFDTEFIYDDFVAEKIQMIRDQLKKYGYT